MNQPRAVSGRERVVGAGENRLVQAQIAELDRAVAAPGRARRAAGARSVSPEVMTTIAITAAATTAPGDDRRRVRARAGVVACPRRERSPAAAAAEAARRCRSRSGARRASSPTIATTWSGSSTNRKPRAIAATPRSTRPAVVRGRSTSRRRSLVTGSSVAHRVERRRGAGDDEAAERQQQRPGEQVAEEGVEDATDRALHLLVAELVLADHSGDEALADHDHGDRRAPCRRRRSRAPPGALRRAGRARRRPSRAARARRAAAR